MRGIILAAGRGSRMGELTKTQPKCLLQIHGRTLLDQAIQNLRTAGCSDIIIVVGYKAEMINVSDVMYVTNHQYANNNILHSLMAARDYLVGPVVVSYSDIWVEPYIWQRLMETPGDIVLAVDRDWQPHYEGRSENPISGAELVYFDESGSASRLGRHLDPEPASGLVCGEFLGLWRMSAAGTAQFCAQFIELDARLDAHTPFHSAGRWTDAYISDMMQELVYCDQVVRCAVVERGWTEFDTAQDYERLLDIAERQRLVTISILGAQ